MFNEFEEYTMKNVLRRTMNQLIAAQRQSLARDARRGGAALLASVTKHQHLSHGSGSRRN